MGAFLLTRYRFERLSEAARRLACMSPEPVCCGSARSADVVNELIRALFARAGGRLYGADREEYERLVTEWTLATAAEPTRPEIVEAA